MLNLQSNCLIGLFFTLILQVNPDVIVVLEERGLKFVGKDETGRRMEVYFLYSGFVVFGLIPFFIFTSIYLVANPCLACFQA